MKKIGKTLLIAIAIIMMIFFNFLGTENISYAKFGDELTLIPKGDCGELLLYNDSLVKDEYVEYESEGKFYPAYGVNKYNKGLNANNLYKIHFYTILTQADFWKIIINGYPYKTLEELGCETEKEAYSATNQAIYCYMHNNNLEKYMPINKAGERVLNAIKLILQNSEDSTEEPIMPNLNVKAIDDLFKLDNIDKDYVSRIYEVEASANFENYDISVEDVENCKYIEKIKITDINNEEQTSFKKGESFKILIPIEELKDEASFRVKANANLETKAIVYGRASYSECKDYVLTGEKYYNTNGALVEKAYKNETEIIINKKEKGTENGLPGVVFDLLNEKKEAVKSGLITDSNGKIELTGIKPGKYYLREIKTLYGYVKYDEDIEIDVDFNEVFKVTVNNAKEIKKIVEKVEKEVIAGKETSTIEKNESKNKVEIEKTNTIKKLPVTGM